MKNPVAIIRRRDIKDYLDDEFWQRFRAWRYHNAGLGLPHGGGWMDYPVDFIEGLAVMEGEWRAMNGRKGE